MTRAPMLQWNEISCEWVSECVKIDVCMFTPLTHFLHLIQSDVVRSSAQRQGRKAITIFWRLSRVAEPLKSGSVLGTQWRAEIYGPTHRHTEERYAQCHSVSSWQKGFVLLQLYSARLHKQLIIGKSKVTRPFTHKKIKLWVVGRRMMMSLVCGLLLFSRRVVKIIRQCCYPPNPERNGMKVQRFKLQTSK